MADNNKMNIIEALKKLRDDIIKWVTNNLIALSKKIDDHNEDTSAHQDIRDNIITCNTFETDQVIVSAHGGIKEGEDLNGLTTHAILKKILYPYVRQVISTISRTPNTTDVLEKGEDQTITKVTVTVTKKSEPITRVALYNGETLIDEKTDEAEIKDGGTFTFNNLSVSVPSTNVVLTVKTTDKRGSVVTANTAGWTFVYPHYVGVCEKNATITEALVKGLTKTKETEGTKTYTFTTNDQQMVLAYPTSYGPITKILDSNGFNNTAAFKATEISITGLDGTPQAYYVYTNDASSVTNFAFTFSFNKEVS